jgi:hypothetical protein
MLEGCRSGAVCGRGAASMGLIADIGCGPIALDTSIFIYYIEEHPDYLPHLEAVFTAVASGKLEIATSAVTLMEVLVIPYRAGDLSLADRYEALLTRMQLAAALSKRCSALLTNDRQMPELPGLKIIQLKAYLTKGDPWIIRS